MSGRNITIDILRHGAHKVTTIPLPAKQNKVSIQRPDGVKVYAVPPASPKAVMRPRPVSPPKAIRRVSPPKRRVSPVRRAPSPPKAAKAAAVHHAHKAAVISHLAPARHHVKHPIVTHHHKGIMYHDAVDNTHPAGRASSFLAN